MILVMQAHDDMARDLEEAEEELERVKVPLLFRLIIFVNKLFCLIDA
jgi:hypothetical protein